MRIAYVDARPGAAAHHLIIHNARSSIYMKTYRPCFSSIAALFAVAPLIITTASIHAQTKAAQLLSATPRGVEFSFSPGTPNIQRTEQDGREFATITFHEQAGQIVRAEETVPNFIVVAAVPADARDFRVTLNSERWSALALPAPVQPAIKRFLPTAEVLKKPALAGAVDEGPVRILEVGWLRGLKIVRIQILPLRRSGSEWHYLSSARIALNWQSSQLVSTSAMRSSDDPLFPFYSQLVINPEAAAAYADKRKTLTGAVVSSPFSEGEQLVKITIAQNGIYKITGSALAGLGVPLANVDPAQIRLYTGPGREFHEKPSEATLDSLREIPILLQENGDGTFAPEETIIFFGRGISDWEYGSDGGFGNTWIHYNNPYTYNNIYWLAWKSGNRPAKRMSKTNISPAGLQAAKTGTHLHKIENDLTNPIESGRNWLGRKFTDGQRYTFTFDLLDPVPGSGIIRARLFSETGGTHFFSFSLNEKSIGSTNLIGITGVDGYLYLRRRNISFSAQNAEKPGNNTVSISYSSSGGFGSAYTDYVELLVRDRLQARDDYLEFAADAGSGTAAFQLSNFSAEPIIIDISRPGEPRYLAASQSEGGYIFADIMSSDPPRRYAASAAPADPVSLQAYTVSDIRSAGKQADLLLITHQDFMQQAQQLAEHKRSFRGMAVEIIDIADIINEFGWGIADPIAIRNFISWAYHTWSRSPSFILFLGDGDYDYRNIDTITDKNWLPPYQSIDDPHIDQLVSSTVEAFFTYVSGDDRIMDLAIGRLPVQTAEQAQNSVDKIIAYESDPEYGIWRTTVTMVADDEFVTGGRSSTPDATHVIDAERIAETVLPDFLNVQKLYLMEYKAVRNTSISGIRKPAAQNALIDMINNGTLIVNYLGHGNPQLWAHEGLFVQSEDLDRVQNGKRLTFIVAATCDFGRFDDPREQSFTEDLIYARNRGAIAVMTATRVVYAYQNAAFNRALYRQMFINGRQRRTLGETFIAARTLGNNFTLTNDEKYTIVGDPTLYLALPEYEARVTTLSPDSLFALGKMRVSGNLHQTDGSRMISNGAMEVIVNDNRKFITYTLASGRQVRYILPGNLLFRGKSNLLEGSFNLQFIVPKDVTYGGTTASMFFYGVGPEWEANGKVVDIPISLRSNILFDSEGPEISIGFKGRESFVDGDVIPRNAMFTAVLRDTISGINVAGEIGHKITLTIDDDTANQLDLTPRFVYFENDYYAGKLEVDLPADLAPGRHTAEFKAWDNSNNSNKIRFEFVLTEPGDLVLEEVINYPNPFSQSTAFTFLLNTEAEVTIAIYTVSGRLVEKLSGIRATAGFNSIEWDGRDSTGEELANGVYLYKITAVADVDGERVRTEYIGKAAVNR